MFNKTKWILEGLFLSLHALICVLDLRTVILDDSLHVPAVCVLILKHVVHVPAIIIIIFCVSRLFLSDHE